MLDSLVCVYRGLLGVITSSRVFGVLELDPVVFCPTCIWSSLYVGIFAFCSICILFHLYFAAFVFCYFCILAICILFFCILSCLYFGIFVFCHVVFCFVWLYFVLFVLWNICILSRIQFDSFHWYLLALLLALNS